MDAVSHPNPEALVAREVGYADTFRLLSLLLLPPTAEVAEGILDGSIPLDMRALFEELSIEPEKAALDDLAAFREQSLDPATALSRMRQDYTRLFTHPERPLISLYEMRFREGLRGAEVPSTLFLNDAALHAEQCYRAAGLVLSDARSREPGDHIALELEFASYVHAQLAASIRGEDDARRTRWERIRAEFVPHLDSWGEDFYSACKHSGCGAVYPWVGQVGGTFIGLYLSHAASS